MMKRHGWLVLAFLILTAFLVVRYRPGRLPERAPNRIAAASSLEPPHPDPVAHETKPLPATHRDGRPAGARVWERVQESGKTLDEVLEEEEFRELAEEWKRAPREEGCGPCGLTIRKEKP